MKVIQNPIKYGAGVNSYMQGNHKIVDYLDDNNILSKRIEYDEFERIVDTKWYAQSGEVLERMHKDYYETRNERGFVEHFKGKTQEYIRKAYTKIENGLKHSIDEFKSKTNPEKSYINEFIYDMKNRLVDVITKKTL